MACSNSQNNAFAEYYGFPNLCITLKIISQNLEGKIEINKKTFEPKQSFIFMYNSISRNQRFVVCCSWSQKASLCFKKHNTSWVIFVTSLCTVSLLTSVRLVSCLQKKRKPLDHQVQGKWTTRFWQYHVLDDVINRVGFQPWDASATPIQGNLFIQKRLDKSRFEFLESILKITTQIFIFLFKCYFMNL